MRPSGRGGRRQIVGCNAPAQDIGDGGVMGGTFVAEGCGVRSKGNAQAARCTDGVTVYGWDRILLHQNLEREDVCHHQRLVLAAELAGELAVGCEDHHWLSTRAHIWHGCAA